MLSLTAVAVMLMLAPRLQRLPLSTTACVAARARGSLVIAYQPRARRAGVRARRRRQRPDRRLPERGGAAGRGGDPAPVLQWLHASYALGGVTGAAIAGGLLVADVDFRWGLPDRGPRARGRAGWNARTRPPSAAPSAQTVFSISALFRTPALWVPALAVLFAFLVEGSMDTWSGLYLRDQLGASAAVAAFAFIGFSGRSSSGVCSREGAVRSRPADHDPRRRSGLPRRRPARDRHRQPRRGGARLPDPGITISAAAPAGFSLTEGIDEDPASAIAAVTTVGYTGFIWSPRCSATSRRRSACAPRWRCRRSRPSAS